MSPVRPKSSSGSTVPVSPLDDQSRDRSIATSSIGGGERGRVEGAGGSSIKPTSATTMVSTASPSVSPTSTIPSSVLVKSGSGEKQDALGQAGSPGSVGLGMGIGIGLGVGRPTETSTGFSRSELHSAACESVPQPSDSLRSLLTYILTRSHDLGQRRSIEETESSTIRYLCPVTSRTTYRLQS
jgi:hypothetical protein